MRNYIGTFRDAFCGVVIELLVHNIQYNNGDDNNVLHTFLTQG